jgi:hypothetical protein
VSSPNIQSPDPHAAAGGPPPGGFGGGGYGPPPTGGYGHSPGGFGGPPPGGFGGPPPGGFGGAPPGGAPGGWGAPPGPYGAGGFGGPPPGAPPGMGSGGDVAGSANTWFILSIICTILCCLPAGIIGIIFTNDAKNMAARGDYAGAEAKLGTGKVAVIAGIVLTVVLWVLYVILMAVGAMRGFF